MKGVRAMFYLVQQIFFTDRNLESPPPRHFKVPLGSSRCSQFTHVYEDGNIAAKLGESDRMRPCCVGGMSESILALANPNECVPDIYRRWSLGPSHTRTEPWYALGEV